MLRREYRKRGFTMIELVVVMLIMGILAGIAVPSLLGYIHLSQFRRNESYAKTMYLSAESTLTHYRASGQWEAFSFKVKEEGALNTSFEATDERAGHIYALRLDAGEFGGDLSGDGALAAQLVEDDTYDNSMMSAAIAIEVDVESGQVYSVFYGTACDGLVYGASDQAGKWLDMNQRDYETRLKERLGYYSVDDVANVVDLEVTRLKITSINLLNSETLTLNWSSNSRHNDYDIKYDVKFYSASDDKLLLSTEITRGDITGAQAALTVENQGARGKRYIFPLSYADGKFTLTLDAMMRADLLAAVSGDTAASSSTSIRRFGGALEAPIDIYAKVQALPTYENMGADTAEYTASTVTKSNTENTMFAYGSAGNDCRVAAFRHLSNIRYVDGGAKFTVTARSLDWTSDSVAVYYPAGAERLGVQTGREVGFPTISSLRAGQTLDGAGSALGRIVSAFAGGSTITNLRLDATSVASGAQYLGLFGENHGTIDSLRLNDAAVEMQSSALIGAGAVCGRSDGSLRSVTVDGDTTVNVTLDGTMTAARGVGGIAGVLDLADGDTVKALSVSGTVTAALTNDGTYSTGRGGIGGVAGYASLAGGAKIEDCENEATVTGSRSTGGIVGCAVSTGGTAADVLSCDNEGLILADRNAGASQYANGYNFGGILGCGDQVVLDRCTSRSGYANGYKYQVSDRALLRGSRVGGILGYGVSSVVRDCSTKAGGYVLGGDYVGGIAGALSGSVSKSIQAESVSVTTNASYVIGNNYVGGIVGTNRGDSTISSCVNTGVTAGYGRYIGGIAGANASIGTATPVIRNCASYISDTNSSIYRMVLGWDAVGSYAGGLAGYNSGKIEFTDADNPITTKSISGIVVGRDYVGGLVGFNDVAGDIDVDYTLIGGRVYATGDCAGGLIGLNASAHLLTKRLTVQPASVQGRYCVGGAIGANIVNLMQDTTMDGIVVKNSLGTVTGEAFCGGLIGYHRTFAQGHAEVSSILNDMENRRAQLLPDVNTSYGNTPTAVAKSGNPYVLTITNPDNSAESLRTASNNMSIRAYAYAGGIVGFCEAESRLVLKDCLNQGSFAQPAADAYPNGSAMQAGVNVESYLRTQSYTAAAEALARELNGGTLHVAIIGGVIGVNGEKHVVDHCGNTGAMNGLSALGGVVGLNEGFVTNCALSGNMGSATQDFVGGVVGQNAGTITLSGPAGDKTRRVTGTGAGVGGVIGVNTAEGTLRASGAAADTDIIVADSALTVTGGAKVGGVAGINRGTLTADGSAYLTNCAALVRAANGYAGGVLGAQEGTNTTLSRAKNLGRQVTANAGAAGGVVGYNGAGNTVRDCVNGGSVASSNGYAGGVVSENAGTVENCTVAREGENGSDITIRTVGVDASGAICAVNRAGAVIRASVPGEGVVISGSATVLGAIAGDNYGMITGAKVTVQPKYDVSGSELTVGGAAGRNSAGGTISGVAVRSDFDKFSRYRYLGGVVGENCAEGTDEETQTTLAAALVTNCLYAGTMTESRSAAGNCYGGVAGLNRGRLEGSRVSGLNLTAVGVYTATSTSTAEQKEALSSHIGGIAGKNEESGTIEKCYIDDEDGGDSSISVQNGMVGGVTGYNRGMITQSGDKSTEDLMQDVSKVSDLLKNAHSESLSADSKWVQWDNDKKVESMRYSGGSGVANGRTMQIIVSNNGNLGGVAGYNAPTGALDRCASGDWLLVNKSDSISVGTGGVIGMNESEKNLSFLLNRAFVGRQLDTADTNRFAGGIIGTQSNTTTSSWTIDGCINYGTVYSYNSHYAGGIVGQWTNNGGTIAHCYNYGNLQTTWATAWVGAAGGIVAQLYHGASGQDFNIISCRNDGSIYGRWGESASASANDSAGILGNVTNYIAWNAGKGDGEAFSINVVDCVNGPGVKIYAASMASGMVGFFSVDDANRQSSKIGQSTENIVLNIDRCRNYASLMYGSNFRAGIFGDRYWDKTSSTTRQVAVKNTYIQNCFSVAYDTSTSQANYNSGLGEIASLRNAHDNSIIPTMDNVGNNYYFKRPTTVTGGSGYSVGSANISDEHRRTGARQVVFGKLSGTNGVFAARVGSDWSDIHNNSAVYHSFYGQMNANNTRTDGKNLVSRSDSQQVYGHTLFTMPDTSAYNAIVNGGYSNTGFQNALKEKNGAMSDMDNYVRTYYREFEHGKTADGDKLDRSFAVNLSQEENGSFDVAITDNDRPLYYEGEVYVEGESAPILENLRFIPNQKGQGLWSGTFTGSGAGYGSGTTTGTFQLPDELTKETAGKTIVLRVRAVSLFEETEASDWVESEQKNVVVLPTPDVNIRLARISGNSGWYDVSLNNFDDFEAFSNWQVEIRLDSKRVVINAANPVVEIEGNELQEMHVTATADPTADGIQPQAVSVSIPTDTPKFRPDASIDQLTATVSGTTIDDLVVSADLTIRQSSGITTPPIYRIELVGTVDGKDIVFAYEDVLVSVGHAVTANFRDIPAQFFASEVSSRRLRAWYAASGLGPVYTYGTTPLRNGGDTAETIRTYKDDGSYTDEAIYSFVLNDSYNWAFGGWTDGAYKRVRSLSELRALPAPELAEPPLNRELVGGELRYTFRWDQDKTYTNAHYTVRLTGITAGGGEVGIPTADVYTDDTAKSFTIAADDWRYRQVRLTVTRVGQTQNEIGLRSTTVYDVKQRLERPGQPVVENPDTNELKYTVSWPSISSETGCAGYRVYIQPENGAEQTLDELVPAGQGSYSVTCDLEQYAGRNVTIYLVAIAQTGSEYENSPNGVSYSMTVPERIATPGITYSCNWNSTANNPIAADRFRSGGLVVTVHPNNAASIPPGGSTYLLRAEITAPDGSTVAYPTTGQVAAMSASGGDYILNLTDLDTRYAGCAVRFYARISNTSGQVSSDWVPSDIVRLPRVKLAQPSSAVEHTDLPMTVNISNLPGVQGNAQQWSARRTTISWPAVENADVYQLALTDGGETTDIRILQTADGVTVQRRNGAAWETVTANADGWFTLREGDSVTGRYAPGGSTGQYYYTYRLDTLLRADANGFTLCLPNVPTLTTQDGQSINVGAVGTTEVSITSNVQANLAGTSAYYAASDEREHTFN